MASLLDIINFALVQLGQQPAMSLDDDVEAVRTLKAIWPVVREAENGDHNWTFAAKRDVLSELTTNVFNPGGGGVADTGVPAWGFEKAYQAPADMFCLTYVGPTYPGVSLQDYRTDDQSEYRLEDGRIITDDGPPIYVLYNSRITDTSKFDPLFVQAVGYKLAADACEKIQQSGPKKQMLLQQYQAAIRRAIRNDSIQLPPEAISDDTWILSRR